MCVWGGGSHEVGSPLGLGMSQKKESNEGGKVKDTDGAANSDRVR